MKSKNKTADVDIARVFAKNVKSCREFLGMTAAELATRSGLTPAAISQIEAGKRCPTLGSSLSISNALGAKMSRLLGEK